MSRKERAIILEFLVHEHIHPKKKKDNDEKFCSDTIDWISALYYPSSTTLKKKKEKKNPN